MYSPTVFQGEKDAIRSTTSGGVAFEGGPVLLYVVGSVSFFSDFFPCNEQRAQVSAPDPTHHFVFGLGVSFAAQVSSRFFLEKPFGFLFEREEEEEKKGKILMRRRKLLKKPPRLILRVSNRKIRTEPQFFGQSFDSHFFTSLSTFEKSN